MFEALFKNWFSRRPPPVEVEEVNKCVNCGGVAFEIENYIYTCKDCGQRMRQILSEKIFTTNKCPDCGSALLEGPQGGLSVNVMCENPACLAEFNVTPILKVAVRNGKGDRDRARMVWGIKADGQPDGSQRDPSKKTQ